MRFYNTRFNQLITFIVISEGGQHAFHTYALLTQFEVLVSLSLFLSLKATSAVAAALSGFPMRVGAES